MTLHDGGVFLNDVGRNEQEEASLARVSQDRSGIPLFGNGCADEDIRIKDDARFP